MARRSSTLLLAFLLLAGLYFFAGSPGGTLLHRRAFKTCVLDPELARRAESAKVPTITKKQSAFQARDAMSCRATADLLISQHYDIFSASRVSLTTPTTATTQPRAWRPTDSIRPMCMMMKTHSGSVATGGRNSTSVPRGTASCPAARTSRASASIFPTTSRSAILPSSRRIRTKGSGPRGPPSS